MSVTFNGKSGEVDRDNWTLMAPGSRYGWRSQSSVYWIGTAVVCLGLLLLTVILVAHNTSAINQWETKYTKLMYEITKGREDLKNERDQLQIHSRNLTEELKALQSQYNTLIASRDNLLVEYNKLSHNGTVKACHQGWIKFNNKCYFVSPNGVAKSWENSRQDCKDRGADLVIITSKPELDFVMRSYGITWIGLYRGVNRGQWTWVDGTDLVGGGFWQEGEPNNSGGEENCVEVNRDASAWNDAPCSRKFSWVCED